MSFVKRQTGFSLGCKSFLPTCLYSMFLAQSLETGVLYFFSTCLKCSLEDFQGALTFHFAFSHIFSSPEDADIYLDSLWGPLFYRMERVQKDGDSSPRISDYFLVSLFLLLNLALQLAIALKIDQVSLETYGDLGQTLLHDACWRVSDHPEFVGFLYPQDLVGLSDASNFDFDCNSPVMTLSMFPNHLDLNHDGFWSTKECAQLEAKLYSLGSEMSKNMQSVLHHMASYDQKHRPGSKSNTSKSGSFVDLGFFKTYGNRIKACLPADPNLCGNFEARNKLKEWLPSLSDPDDRVEECQDLLHSFCGKIFGRDYRWLSYETSKVCGDVEFERENGINVAQYDTVATYRGETDSILGQTFVSFLVLLLFVWLMLMLNEFRAIWNFLIVTWYTPSTSNQDPHFASMEDEKMNVHLLPISHKIFVLLGVLLPRCHSRDQDLPSFRSYFLMATATVTTCHVVSTCGIWLYWQDVYCQIEEFHKKTKNQ